MGTVYNKYFFQILFERLVPQRSDRFFVLDDADDLLVRLIFGRFLRGDGLRRGGNGLTAVRAGAGFARKKIDVKRGQQGNEQADDSD